MRRYEPIAGITVGAAGSDSTMPVPTDRRLLAAQIYASGTVSSAPAFGADVLDGIQIYVGTRLVRDVTAQEVLDIAKGNGYAATPSATVPVTIYFMEPWRASVMDETAPAWDVFNQASVTIKARTKAGVTDFAVKTVLAYDDEFTTAKSGPDAGKRVLNIIKQEPINLGTLGTVADILTPQIPVDLPIQRIWVYPAAGVTISSVKVTINDNIVTHDLTQAENIRFLSDYDMVAEAGNGKVFPVVFDVDQQLFNGLPAVNKIKLSLTQSSAGVVKLVLERRAADYR